MKYARAVISNTYVDSQGERMTRHALEGLVSHLKQAHVPLGVEHDPRRPPLGRIADAEIRDLPDGESEVVAVIEVFESGDEPPLIPDDERELVLRDWDGGGMSISYDWTFRHDEDQADIAAIAELLGTQPDYEIKKSADPISVIVIGAGVFAVAAFASGFLNKMGSDSWDFVKGKLAEVLNRRADRRGEQLLILSAGVRYAGATVEVQLILTNPTREDLDRALETGLATIESWLPGYLESEPAIRLIVFQWEDGRPELSYAVRRDCVPLRFRAGGLDDTDNLPDA